MLSDPIRHGEYDFMQRQMNKRGYRGRQLMQNREMGPPRDMMGPPPPPPPPIMMGNEGDVFNDNRSGGNYWVNPTERMDAYPDMMQRSQRMMRDDDEDGMMMLGGGNSRSRRGGGGRRGGNRRRRMNMLRRDMEDLEDLDDEEEWWVTRRRDMMDDEEDDFFDDEFDEYDDDEYEYGVPPPTRSRSSFRSGAPPPPRPVKQFYDKLFWFGFDPDVTRPTDRTMFGGTRGKFNAMDLLSDREERQRMRYGGGGGGGRMTRRSGKRTGQDPIIQDFGDVRDWNASKQGGGRVGGDAVGDDNGRPYFGYDREPAPFPGDMPPPPPPPGMPEYDFNMDLDGGGMGRQRGRRRGGSRRRRSSTDNRRRNMDRRAEEYNRVLGMGPMSDIDDDYMPMDMDDEYIPLRSSSRRRNGFAYKYNDIDLLQDDGEYIDVEPKYASERDLGMAARDRGEGRRRRSW